MSHTPSATTVANAAAIRREFDVLLAATQGIGASSLIHALAIEAVTADTGKLKTTDGTEGYVWQPRVYETKAPTNPVHSRICAAGASLGRILAGGHPTNRAYLAFMEAIYQVTTSQADDVADRIQALWDAHEAAVDAEPAPEPRTPWYARLWRRLRSWWKATYEPLPENGEEVHDATA